jgi:hypothetical protein
MGHGVVRKAFGDHLGGGARVGEGKDVAVATTASGWSPVGIGCGGHGEPVDL